MTRPLIAAWAVLCVGAISALASFEPWLFGFLTSIPFGDKAGHFGLFGLLTLVLVWSNLGGNPALGVLIAVLLVVLEESAQLFIETRTFSMADFSASILGVCSAASLFYVYRSKAAT